MESLNQEILKQLLQSNRHSEAVRTTVEIQLKQWIDDGGHIEFLCKDQKQVTFQPLTYYNFDKMVLLYSEKWKASDCQRIMLEDIKNLFQLYFDKVTEETKQKFIVRVNESDIVVDKVEPKAVDPKLPSKAPTAKTDLCNCYSCEEVRNRDYH